MPARLQDWPRRCLAQRDTVAVSKNRSKGAKQIPCKLQERSRLDPVKRGQFQHSTRGRTQMSCKLQERPRPSHPGGPAKRGKYREILHAAAAGVPVAARSHYGRPRTPLPGGPAKPCKYHEILHGAAAGGPVAARSHYGRPRTPRLDFIILEQTGTGSSASGRAGSYATASSSIVSTVPSQTGCADNFVLEPSHHFLPCSALGRWDWFRFTARQVVLKMKFPNQAKYGLCARGPHSIACLHLFQAHPQQYASRIPSFYFLSMFPPRCGVRLSVSSTDNITIASMFLGPKNATNLGHKNKPALFGEDTGGLKFGTQFWDPRKL